MRHHTAAYKALGTAFPFDDEAIYFPSNGRPEHGQDRRPFGDCGHSYTIQPNPADFHLFIGIIPCEPRDADMMTCICCTQQRDGY